ncbi:hypothetical protein [Nostoc sp.]|uniref:hypothetical protein n=1 Tax=Nostoc sp. TaxID=1180 RepID=UPI002FFA4A26
MKTRFLVVIAATSAFVSALSSVIVAPANAQVSTTNNVAVTLSVPEVLYLRTVSTIDLDLKPADLSAKTLIGSGPYTSDGTDKTGTANSSGSTLDQSTPFNTNGTNLSVDKTISKVFAVWSNSPRGLGITVDATVANAALTNGTATATLSSNGANPNFAPVPGLVTPFVGGVDLTIDVPGNGIAQAGTYSGATLDIKATAN